MKNRLPSAVILLALLLVLCLHAFAAENGNDSGTQTLLSSNAGYLFTDLRDELDPVYTDILSPVTLQVAAVGLQASPDITVNGTSIGLAATRTMVNEETYLAVIPVLQAFCPSVQVHYADGCLTASAPTLSFSATVGKAYFMVNDHYLYAPNDVIEQDGQVMLPAARLAQALAMGMASGMPLEEAVALASGLMEDTPQAKARIGALEGSAAALRAEGEAKAQGRTALQDRVAKLNGESAQHSARLAGLEGEQSALGESIRELERLRDDLSGDTASRAAMIGQFEQQNDYLARRIREEEERLQGLRAASLEGTAAIRRLNDEKLALEGKRNQADREARDKNNELNTMEREVAFLEQKSAASAMEESQILDKLWEGYQLSHEAARAQRVELESVPKAQRRIGELKKAISALGSINPDAVEEFIRVNERYTYFTGQRDDVAKAKKELEDIIAQITGEMTEIFKEQFALIDQEFRQAFAELFGGGKAELILDDPEDVLGCGIEIKAQPPGKTIQHMSSLSGGERALIAIALYFAILKVRPTPFCVMDEIEAALDESNVVRYARYMRRMSGKTQFIVITHRRGTMEEADVLYGVTMQEKGVSRMLTINLNDVEKELNIK